MIKPGAGLEIALNEQSKRKTPSAVAFTADGERLFGDAAITYSTKFPEVRPTLQLIFSLPLFSRDVDGNSQQAHPDRSLPRLNPFSFPPFCSGRFSTPDLSWDNAVLSKTEATESACDKTPQWKSAANESLMSQRLCRP